MVEALRSMKNWHDNAIDKYTKEGGICALFLAVKNNRNSPDIICVLKNELVFYSVDTIATVSESK